MWVDLKAYSKIKQLELLKINILQSPDMHTYVHVILFLKRIVAFMKKTNDPLVYVHICQNFIEGLYTNKLTTFWAQNFRVVLGKITILNIEIWKEHHDKGMVFYQWICQKYLILSTTVYSCKTRGFMVSLQTPSNF